MDKTARDVAFWAIIGFLDLILGLANTDTAEWMIMVRNFGLTLGLTFIGIALCHSFFK